jgi:hypothetical protein
MSSSGIDDGKPSRDSSNDWGSGYYPGSDSDGDRDGDRSPPTPAERRRCTAFWEAVFSGLWIWVAVKNGDHTSEVAQYQPAVYSLCLVLWYLWISSFLSRNPILIPFRYTHILFARA